jgi:hypothetical protein
MTIESQHVGHYGKQKNCLNKIRRNKGQENLEEVEFLSSFGSAGFST